jgi:hypothetical protein
MELKNNSPPPFIFSILHLTLPIRRGGNLTRWSLERALIINTDCSLGI